MCVCKLSGQGVWVLLARSEDKSASLVAALHCGLLRLLSAGHPLHICDGFPRVWYLLYIRAEWGRSRKMLFISEELTPNSDIWCLKWPNWIYLQTWRAPFKAATGNSSPRLHVCGILALSLEYDRYTTKQWNGDVQGVLPALVFLKQCQSDLGRIFPFKLCSWRIQCLGLLSLCVLVGPRSCILPKITLRCLYFYFLLFEGIQRPSNGSICYFPYRKSTAI